MTRESCLRAILIAVLCVGLAVPARADTSLKTAATEIVIGIVAVTAAVTVLVIVLIHKAQKTAITGCVSAGENGTTITDEKDRQIYTLSGNTTGVKPGDRMKLKGKKIKTAGSIKTLVLEAKAVTKDFGVCHQ
jgi:hypothetical protein